MKTFLELCVLAAVVASVLAIKVDFTFDSDAIVNNEIQFRALQTCILHHGPCNGEHQRFREVAAKVIPNNCSDCTVDQKQNLEQMMKKAFEKYPKATEEIMRKFGGKREYFKLD